jgi:lipopolysaccharide transport system permease protein
LALSVQGLLSKGSFELMEQSDIAIKPGMGALHYWRGILVRYKQTATGTDWSVLRPLVTMVVFTIVFGRQAKLPSNGVPYPVMCFAAMLLWQFFANALSESGNSLIGNANLLTKVYFPLLIVPAGMPGTAKL